MGSVKTRAATQPHVSLIPASAASRGGRPPGSSRPSSISRRSSSPSRGWSFGSR